MSQTAGGTPPNELAGTAFSVSETETVPDGADVRHFDQLDDRTQRALVAALSDRPTPADVSELSTGDVVVFTRYYEVD